MDRLVRKAWPGPVTLIASVTDPLTAEVLAGTDGSAAGAMYYDNTIGLRCPDEPIAQAMLQACTGPVVAASANARGAPPPHSADQVAAGLGDRIDLLLDAGPTRYAKPSTIVRVEGSTFEVVREGVFDAAAIARLAVVRVLFVCTGNTCRSPMAAGIARRAVARRLECEVAELTERGVEVASAGTAGGFGPAAEHAQAAMARRAIDISDHSSRSLTADLVRQADYIYGMTRSHVDRIIELVPTAADRVFRLDPDHDLRDPIGGSDEEYERCARAIEDAVDARFKEVAL
jgi:protein-tyrosine phosphatase